MKMVLAPDPNAQAERLSKLLSELVRRNFVTFRIHLDEGEYVIVVKPAVDRILWHFWPLVALIRCDFPTALEGLAAGPELPDAGTVIYRKRLMSTTN